MKTGQTEKRKESKIQQQQQQQQQQWLLLLLLLLLLFSAIGLLSGGTGYSLPSGKRRGKIL
jgi:ABC-type cobalamin transport system permease subunit